MSVLDLELRKTPFVVAAPTIYVVATVFAVTSSYPNLASWTNVTFAVFTAQSFVVPLICGVAAWSALRARRRRLWPAEWTSARSLSAVRLPQMVADTSWVLVASLAMTTALIVRGLVIGMTGTPVLTSFIYGVSLPTLFVIAGHVVGLLVRHWVAIPLAVGLPLALYAANTFGTGSSSILALNPLYRFANIDPYQPSVFFYSGQLLVLVGYVIILFLIVVTVDRSRSWFPTAMLAIAAVPVMVVGAALLQTNGANAVIAREPGRIVIDNPDQVVQLHVLDLYRPVAAELSLTWGRIAALTADSDLTFTVLEQDLDPSYDPLAPAGSFYRLDLNPNSSAIAASSVDLAFNDVAACASSGQAAEGDWWLEGFLVVRTWFQGARSFPTNVFVGDPDMQSALDAMHGLSGKESAAWVADHEDKIRSCDWNRADFPI